MLLKASSASSRSLARGDSFGPLFSSAPPSSPPSVSYSFSPLTSTSMSSILRFSLARNESGVVVCASKNANNRPLTGVVFEPFEEVKKELDLVPSLPQVSLARQKFTDESEAAINEQINVEYNVSYIYHAMYAYFDRDNVALKGLAKFFKESSEEERDHAEKLMEYQNKRGGRVKLQSILMPVSEFEHPEKGDALYAMELALSLEKLTNEKLLHLHSVAVKNKDPQLTDFVETEFLAEQVEAIKKISEYVAQLRRVGKGHGVWHFDQALLHGDAVAA
ncbi:ferritin-3, chloroplastic-like isoform X4 [Malus sylvestris]|uniref:ferritin-3, chloroplastic-like isoform X4 n=1 Tax=Malus sylvestris TaxID=3752 RepID=UPI0021AC9340|nr:ferritin-3, chloroplastic-like isoform X4 [Malus sylvestris]